MNAKYQESSYFKRNRVIWVHKNSITEREKKDQFIKIHKNVVLTTVLDEQNKTKNKTNSQTRSVL